MTKPRLIWFDASLFHAVSAASFNLVNSTYNFCESCHLVNTNKLCQWSQHVEMSSDGPVCHVGLSNPWAYRLFNFPVRYMPELV